MNTLERLVFYKFLKYNKDKESLDLSNFIKSQRIYINIEL